MSIFKSYDMESVPERSKEALQKTVDKYGAVMNIFADMAESPLPIEIYGAAQDRLMKESSLGAENVNFAQMAVSIENGCEFCVPAHTVAANSLNSDKDVVAAIREGRESSDDKVNALVKFTRLIVRKRARLSDAEVQEFLDAGFTKENVFEVITIAAYKTITNYTSAITGTQPNEAMQEFAWSPEDDAQQSAKQAA